MKRKYGMLAAMVVLLIVAVVVNYHMNQDANDETAMLPGMIDVQKNNPKDETPVDSGDYFETFRTDRENVRNKELDYLETIITHDQTDAETLADAQQQKLDIVSGMEKEFTVEKLLKAKGFTDAAVTFHAGSVNVVIDTPSLSEEQVAQILEIVVRETGESAENIKISTIR